MAIDTAEKRFSMMGVGNPSIKHLIPQGALGKPGRATLMDLYSGIALSAPSSVGNMQKNWDYITGNVKSLQITTKVESLDLKAGC